MNFLVVAYTDGVTAVLLEQRDNDGETALMRARAKNLPASVAVLVAAVVRQ